MPLKKRIAVFVGLWLLAGVFFAVFSDITVEAGDSDVLCRLQLVYLAPLFATAGVAFTIVHGQYETAHQRELYQQVVGWITIGIFTLHAVIALTRRSRQQFIGLTIIQVLFLIASTACVLYFFHYDATHGRG